MKRVVPESLEISIREHKRRAESMLALYETKSLNPQLAFLPVAKEEPTGLDASMWNPTIAVVYEHIDFVKDGQGVGDFMGSVRRYPGGIPGGGLLHIHELLNSELAAW